MKELQNTEIHSCPGLGRQVDETLHRPNDERYVLEVTGSGLETKYQLTTKRGVPPKLPLSVKWDQKNYWYAPCKDEEVWSPEGRPGWYWEIVAKAAVAASPRLTPGLDDLAQLDIAVPSVFRALAEVLGVTCPEVLPDLRGRVVPMSPEGISLLARLNSTLPAGRTWDDYLTPADIKDLGSGDAARERAARAKIEGLPKDVLFPGTDETPTPALSRARVVAVHRDIMTDRLPADVRYQLTLSADRHGPARRHLIAHELMHAHSGLGCGLQDVSTEVDEAYTEVLARLVTDTLTAVETGVARPGLATDRQAQEKVATEAQYNVFVADSKGAEQAKGALRYQKNVWALVRSALTPARDPYVRAQVESYFSGKTPAGSPVTASVVHVSTPGAGARPLSGRTGSRQAPVHLYMPDDGAVDYHLLVVPGPPAHAVLVDCGCDDRSRGGAVVAELRALFQRVLPTAPDGRRHLDAVVISRSVPRRYNMLAAATQGLSVGMVHHTSPAPAYNAPSLEGGIPASEWLKEHDAREFPAAFSTLKRPLLTAGAAAVHVLGAHLDGSAHGQAGASGSAVLLVTYGGVRLLLASDADTAAARSVEKILKGAGAPAVFTPPASLAVVTGRPSPEAGKWWPWTQGLPAQFGPPVPDHHSGRPRRIVVAGVAGDGPPDCGAVISTVGHEAVYGHVAEEAGNG
ncbi:hypothetical protein EES41_30795 [Streptomyces sp. ADI95-16]|uniref:hypothetical protein n=1 Tax=Streptomyces sp. ADI95-16 TaxID=1522758 RepID=UPI000F434F8D|nr:hypothetical protein [Streptomyces sp. ADI95-16]AYV31124.1 hypothetical protein EES41_30795 [Streptomyces sp. ADI95-16]